MNEVTLSTNVKNDSPRLAIKMDVTKLGVQWGINDVIRVMSYKKDGTLILKRVGTKSAKTVAHKLTKTGGGDFDHSLGIYVSYKPTRFRNKFKSASSVSAGARFIDAGKNMLQVFLPRDIFENEACLKSR
ncbi:MAG: hypothetical protein QG564_1336 [Campylobacterota bacterium]|nr:hypothetical protein [Campylobacterota bacterium]